MLGRLIDNGSTTFWAEPTEIAAKLNLRRTTGQAVCICIIRRRITCCLAHTEMLADGKKASAARFLQRANVFFISWSIAGLSPNGSCCRPHSCKESLGPAIKHQACSSISAAGQRQGEAFREDPVGGANVSSGVSIGGCERRRIAGTAGLLQPPCRV